MMLMICGLPFLAAKSQVKISYVVSFKEPQTHYAEIEMNVSGLSKPYVDVKMPVWTPGSYLIREFAKNVEDVSATAGNTSLKVEKVKKNTWRIYSNKSNSLKINYSVYSFEVSVRTPFVDASHAFIFPTGVFMYPDNQLSASSTVKIIPFKGWEKVSTGLEPVAGQPFTYMAKNFDILFDSPIEVGNQEIFEFMAAGVKHTVAMYGGGKYDPERLKVDMPKIVEEATALYGENPNQHYTFIVHNLSKGSGGLEHLNSTVLGVARDSYATDAGYKSFLGLVAHEYHHLWNVKRLRPVALGPFDYENENYTTNLWIAEGFTSYYENKFMLRAGYRSPDEFAGSLINKVANIINTPGSKVESAAASSFDAWIKYYRPNENSNNSTVSYYNKGEVIGLLLDLEIINATKSVKSLDDVMKAMYLQCKAKGRGYTDAEFKAMAEQISGISLNDFWEKYVNGVYPIEYAKYFGYAGIKVQNENEGKNLPYLGIATRASDGHVSIIAVSRDSGAWKDGLNVNDEVISIDGADAEPNVNGMGVLAGKKVGDVITVKIKRDFLDKEIKVTLRANPNVSLVPSIPEGVTEGQRNVLKKWMSLK
ncbi:Predicted metalloprotease, contains C-terminal PDZ domain [Pedobacter westerhofensis]|uniref:Predicted metalloprotease, contains C-terminal PDZ domain n=2 Tax=Pedobacter westerhofensis TaxID=425512 RepID=A0A521C1C7_9SPHI|nr:Predicted metalloprotease, contains C-terminal PDZ domain [Pedobacter westerhofensis]